MSELYEPIQNELRLRRDTRSNAVVNTDNKALKAYKKKKAYQKRLNNMENDLKVVMNEMSEIRSMLKSIVNRNK